MRPQNQSFTTMVSQLTGHLDEYAIPYTIVGCAGLVLLGVELRCDDSVDVLIQWDQLQTAHTRFGSYNPGALEKGPREAGFSFFFHTLRVRVRCEYNTVIVTDPDRSGVNFAKQTLWVRSIDSYSRDHTLPDAWRQSVEMRLQSMQSSMNAQNRVAWTHSAYAAWTSRYGTPSEAAARIQKDPQTRLSPLGSYLGELQGQRVLNLLGSHGGKAVAMAILGASVTVVDISSENARYASELAEAAGVAINYIVADVLELTQEQRSQDYDAVVMELGILHYFIDLAPLARVVADTLRKGGRLVLHDFHPVSTKLIASRGSKHKVVGNYFSSALEETDVAYSKYIEHSGHKVRLRKWTMGEIVTAFANADLRVLLLHEEPNHKIDDIGIPKTFTLIAEKL